MPSSPVTQVRPGGPRGGCCPGKPEHHPSRPTCPPRHQVLWILPSKFVSSMFLPLHPHCHCLSMCLTFSRWTISTASCGSPCFALPGQSAHTGRMIFFNITNLSMLKTLQCLTVTFRTKSQLQGHAIPAGLSDPTCSFPLRSNCTKLLVTLTRSPAPSTVLSRCLLNNNNCIHNSCHLLNIYFLSGTFTDEEAKAQRG